MLRKIAGLIILTLAAVTSAFSFQKTAPAEPKPPKNPPALTDEEKEMLKHRELLENLELLQNFEKIKYFNFLTVKKPDAKVKQADKAPVKDNEKKKIDP
jgi:hypothetical protein